MLKKANIKKNNQVKLTFVLPMDPSGRKVSVVGDFNHWDPQANPLIKRNNGTMSSAVTLDPGQRVRFRYFAADGEWFNDEHADAYEPGEHGAENCIAIV